jgi:hypothetical protein
VLGFDATTANFFLHTYKSNPGFEVVLLTNENFLGHFTDGGTHFQVRIRILQQYSRDWFSFWLESLRI